MAFTYLAQMVRDPYLVFFNHFNEENNWKGVTLKEEDILFCKAVTRQFLRYSPVAIVKEVTPLLDYELPKEWIYSHIGGHNITISVKGRERQVVWFWSTRVLWFWRIRTVDNRRIIHLWGSSRLISYQISKNRIGIG